MTINGMMTKVYYPFFLVCCSVFIFCGSTVLTWISLYYFSRAGPAASVRIYYEVVRNAPGGKTANISVGTITTPLGISYFPKEVIKVPRKYVPYPSLTYCLNTIHFRWHKTPNLVFESEHDSGGHFAAHEKPEALVNDLRNMFGKSGPVFGVVKGKNGYSS